jgi:hypothetical protein
MTRRSWLGLGGLAAVAAAVWQAFPRLGRRAQALYWSATMGRGEGALKPGDVAPDLELQYKGSPQTVKLSSFRGQRPVALVFGSYT